MDNVSFGEFLRLMIKVKGFTFAEFRRRIELSKTYLVDIQNGDAFPPPELQVRMADILQLTDYEKHIFYDKAATGRKELPADVFRHLFENPKVIKKIRESMRD